MSGYSQVCMNGYCQVCINQWVLLGMWDVLRVRCWSQIFVFEDFGVYNFKYFFRIQQVRKDIVLVGMVKKVQNFRTWEVEVCGFF